MLFDAFRTIPGPTLYYESRHPVMGDVIVVGLLVAFAGIMFSFLVGILPGVAGGWTKKLSVFIRAFFAAFVGASILVSIFGDGWMVDTITTNVYLKQFTTAEVHAEVGFHIGLRGINITLKGTPDKQALDNRTIEEINYNEHYDFGDLQGRLGFGPQAGLVSQEFRTAQYRGSPLPVLWILEYFTLDGEDIRWGRNFRQAGYYTNLLLWSSFAFWILSTFLFTTAISSACFLLWITGLLQLIAVGVYAGMRDQHGPPLRIPIAEAAVLTPHYGWSFILTTFTGIVCILVGSVIYYLYLRMPELLFEFFDSDLLEEEDYLEVQRTIDEKDGYAKTWGQQDLSPDPKTPLSGGVSPGDLEAGEEGDRYIRKSRRSKRVRSKKSTRNRNQRPHLSAIGEEEQEPSVSVAANGDMEMKQKSVSLSEALRNSIRRKKKQPGEEETAINEAMEVAEDDYRQGDPAMV